MNPTHDANDMIVAIPANSITQGGEPFLVSVAIGDDEIFLMEFIHEDDGSLYYRVMECANPEFVIEGHYPEYFEEGE